MPQPIALALLGLGRTQPLIGSLPRSILHVRDGDIHRYFGPKTLTDPVPYCLHLVEISSPQEIE